MGQERSLAPFAPSESYVLFEQSTEFLVSKKDLALSYSFIHSFILFVPVGHKAS